MNPIHDWISFDVESEGDKPCYALQPWRVDTFEARIRTYAMSWVEKNKIQSTGVSEVNRVKLHKKLLLCASKNKIIVGWNVAFDISWLFAMGLREEVYANKWLDAMILWKQLDRARRTYGLKEAVREFFPNQAGYEEGVDFEGDIETLLEYNKKDTEFTLLLALKFWAALTESERRSVLIDMEDLPVVAERNYKGLELNPPAILETHAELMKRRNEAATKLAPYLPDGFNLDSSQQVAKLLFEDWGLPVYKLTPKQKPSVDEESLVETSHLDERAKWVQEYRSTTGLLSKCVKAPIKALEYNKGKYSGPPIVHPELRKAGTVTDRCTYSSYQNGPAK